MTKRDTESGNAKAPKDKTPPNPATARADRLAARLRDNLRRRKITESKPEAGDDEGKTG